MIRTGNQVGSDTLWQSVAQRAYAIWEAEGRPQGRDFEHWLRAEAEFNAPASARRQVRRLPANSRARAHKRDV